MSREIIPFSIFARKTMRNANIFLVTRRVIPPRGDNLSRLNKSTPIFFFAPETLYLSGYLYLLYFVILYRIMLKFHISYHLRVERYKFYLLIVVRRKFTATNCTVVLDTLLRVSGKKMHLCFPISRNFISYRTFNFLSSGALRSRVLALLNYMFAWALAIS